MSDKVVLDTTLQHVTSFRFGALTPYIPNGRFSLPKSMPHTEPRALKGDNKMQSLPLQQHSTFWESLLEIIKVVMENTVDILNTPTFHSLIVAVIIWITIYVARR